MKIQLNQFVQHKNTQYNAVALTSYTLLSKGDHRLSRNKRIPVIFTLLCTYLFFI